MINLNKLIAEAMKNQDKMRLEVLRGIKTEFTKYLTIKKGNILDENMEAMLLTKMVNQYKDSIKQFKEGGRQDLVDKESSELMILLEFAPKDVSEDEIKRVTNHIIDKITQQKQAITLSMKDMKEVLHAVQMIYPTANGKIVSESLKESIK